MDKRSWPWKKKSSDKNDKSVAASASAAASQADQEKVKKPKYVQITVETYSHLTGLEDQVKAYEDEVKALENKVDELNEKLSAAETEITNKENAVKQHSKVAEEAVAGWEKAEAEAEALKSKLESVTLLKLTAEDRASHLDDALKECMKQIRNLKEEHEQNLHEVVMTHTNHFDRMQADFEAKIANLDQELMISAAENTSLSRSLQERSNMLIKMSHEKADAEAEIESLKNNIDACQREINSLKYETHVLAKELEIRNEEKNMSARSADVANKQHLEGVKKITKLEAECQRLRGLVKKKLPGPAAMAQMKLEVESLGRDYGETRVRRSPVKPPSPHSPQFSEFSLDNTHFMERLVALEEETKMLKEALAMRNSELQASRNMCAKTVNKLQSLESLVQANNRLTSPSKSNNVVLGEGFLSHTASSPTSFTSVSEDGNDDQESCAGSWATGLVSEKLRRSESASQLELMDDFLEIEKLAHSSNNSTAAVSVANTDSLGVTHGEDSHSEKKTEAAADSSPLKKLQSRISMMLDSIPEDADVDKILDDIKRSVQNPSDNKSPQKDITLSVDSKPDEETTLALSDGLVSAVSLVHEFLLVLGKKLMAIEGLSSDEDGLSHKIQNFGLTLDSVIQGKTSLNEFVHDLSRILNKACKLRFNILGFKNEETETNGSDCIDKVALPENKVVQDLGDKYSHFSDPDTPNEGNYTPVVDSNGKCVEFEELKQHKDKLVLELARSNENFENTKAQLMVIEQLLEEAKSQLVSAQKTNGLTETQLKCMAGSYRSLETRADELQTEVNLFQAKIKNLDNELEEEKNNHQDTLIKCKDLEEQLQSIAGADKPNQERELTAASQKLAECQETIFLLGKQLNSLHPHTGSPLNDRTHKSNPFAEEEPTISSMVQDYDQIDNLQRLGAESPLDPYNSPFIPSHTEVNSPLRSPSHSSYPKHQPTKSELSNSSSNPTPEKNSRGFSRFFSSKSKNGN